MTREPKPNHVHARDLVNALAVVAVSTADVTESVTTPDDGPALCLAFDGPIYGTIHLFGNDAPEVRAAMLVQVNHAAAIIAQLQERFRDVGQGPTLTAQVDQWAAEVRERIRIEKQNRRGGRHA